MNHSLFGLITQVDKPQQTQQTTQVICFLPDNKSYSFVIKSTQKNAYEEGKTSNCILELIVISSFSSIKRESKSNKLPASSCIPRGLRRRKRLIASKVPFLYHFLY